MVDYTNLFSPNDCEKNHTISIEISYILENTLVTSIIWSKCINEEEKIFKEEESIEILKFLV